MIKQILKNLAKRLLTPHPLDFSKTCEAHPAAVFTNTARVIPNGFPPSRIKVGANSRISGELTLFGHGGQISIGEWCFVGEQSRLWSGREIAVGNRVLISHHVTIMDNLTHPIDHEERAAHCKEIFTNGHPHELDLDDRPVCIEDDVWIGCQSVILRGVNIGKRSIVAAGSVVTKDVPPDVIVAGNPATVIKRLTPKDGLAEREG